MSEVLGATKQRLIELLKRAETATVPGMARELGVSTQAVRQHLAELQGEGLVVDSPSPGTGVGRPAAAWTLTDEARVLFPDRHADLTVELLTAIGGVGEDTLGEVLDTRRDEQVRRYRRAVPSRSSPLADRVAALAALRADEGYLAEARPNSDGSVSLIEHHCPIAEAAVACNQLCQAELEAFQAVLGATASVERERHLLAGDDRCVYRVTTVASGRAPGRSRAPKPVDKPRDLGGSTVLPLIVDRR